MRGALRRSAAAAAATAATCRRALSDVSPVGGGKRLQDVVLSGSAPPVSVMGPGKGGAPAAGAGAISYKGATFDKRTGKWRASITVNKKKIELGVFGDAKSASDAYVAAKAVYAGQQYGRGGRTSTSSSAKADGASGVASPAAAEAGAAAAPPQAGSGPGRGAAAAAPPPAAAAPVDAAVEVEEVQVPAMVIDLDDSGSDADVAAAASTQSPPPSGPPPRVASSKYRGVIQEGEGATMWEAVVVANGREISGGEYESEEDAARAHDALARMYLGPDAATNFPADVYTSWLPPEAVAHTGQIETKPGVPLAVDEVVEALKQERGVDVKAIDIRGKSDLAEWLLFVTGTSPAHMRRMADMVSRALRKRRLPGIDPTVEAREMDDWMVVDCGNIIVNVFDAEAREVFDLEAMYTNMGPPGSPDPDSGLTYEEWLQRHPIPEKWLKRLERDEEELEAAQRVPRGAGR